MERKMKGIALPIVLLAVFLVSGGTAGVSVAIAHSPDVLPDNALYGLKTAGRAIECAFAANSTECWAGFILDKQNEVQRLRELGKSELATSLEAAIAEEMKTDGMSEAVERIRRERT